MCASICKQYNTTTIIRLVIMWRGLNFETWWMLSRCIIGRRTDRRSNGLLVGKGLLGGHHGRYAPPHSMMFQGSQGWRRI